MNNSYPNEVYLNGRWLPNEQAAVSVFDRGFMLGDGIYEVIPFYRGKLFTQEEHIQRLQSGLTAVGIAYRADLLKDEAIEAVARSGYDEGAVYIQVTRGAAPRTHHFPVDVEPTVLLYAYPLSFGGFEKKLIDVVLDEDFRWHRCDIKSISLMANVLANNAARQLGVAEKLLVRQGLITEGTHTSVFFVKQGVVYTHPNGPHILPGITRSVVIACCEALGIEVREEAVAAADLYEVDEAFLTGTTTQVTAIGSVIVGDEKRTIGTAAGPVTRRIQEAFISQIEAI